MQSSQQALRRLDVSKTSFRRHVTAGLGLTDKELSDLGIHSFTFHLHLLKALTVLQMEW